MQSASAVSFAEVLSSFKAAGGIDVFGRCHQSNYFALGIRVPALSNFGPGRQL
jgi:hypothetical protein